MSIFEKLKKKIAIPWTVTRNQAYLDYSVNYETFLKEAYNNPFIYQAINEIVTNFNTVKIGVFKNQGGKWIYNEKSQVNKWLERPNPELTKSQWQSYYIIWKYLGGGLLLNKSMGINKKDLYMYAPNTFQIKRDSQYRLAGIQIGEKSFEGQGKLKNFQICKAINPNDSLAGMSDQFRSPLTSIALAGDMSNFALIHQNRQLKNSGKRLGIMRYEGITNQDKLEEVKNKFNAMGRDSDTGGVAWVPGKNLQWQSLDITPQEMDWLNSVQFIQEVIAQALGVPIQLISSRGSTYNNVAELKKKIYIDTVIPAVKNYCEDMTTFLSDDLEENEKIWYDVSEIEELKADIMNIAKDLSTALKGKVTINEFREVLAQKTGIELKKLPKEIGDKVIVSTSDVFLDDLNLDESLPPNGESVDDV